MYMYRMIKSKCGHRLRNIYCGLYKRCKINTLLRAMSPEFQNKAIPFYYNNLLIRTIVIKTDLIKWGGRPPDVVEREEFIIEGDWDVKYKLPVKDYLYDYPNSRAVFDVFVYGKHYKETKRYQNMMKLLRENKIDDWRLKRCKTEKDIDEYFLRIKCLYESVKNDGYKSQKHLGTIKANDEICVYIDRNGEFHKLQGSGHHRLAIAKILEIKNIPVTIRGIHFEWAKKLSKNYRADIITAINNGIDNLKISGGS